MLIKELVNRSNGDTLNHKVAKYLSSFAEIVAERANDHAKRILQQLPEFDLHDEVHLAAVLSNMEQIIGQHAMSNLSSYELFFMHTSSYLHDVGMALPDWELKVIEAVESENENIDGSWKKDFSTNGGRPISISHSRQLITRHSLEIYVSFEAASKWFFSPESEVQLVEHLAQTVVQYQEFRGGFTKKLNSLIGDELKRYVKFLRIDFIRQTHHLRTHRYVKNLGRHMTEEIMQPWGTAITHALADICQAHGEPISFVEKMKTDAQYVGSETANLQFVASLLRVADIVHFSIDRAPSILASEMQFLSEESFIHWAVKQQGVNYNVSVSGEMGKKTFKFRAYCTEPRYYYALHKYLDWVDHELVNYAKLSRRWELAYVKQISEKWSIPLADEVDRSGIDFDADKFVPVPGLSFSLDQKRILELLMGVQLYKDKYACLRELYQNSLDACKCMIALSDHKENGQVEFWLESRDSGKESYLCCMDNGVGMTKEIIVNHLLRIGNSYYTSSAFERLRVSHENSFTPTSQFGIGILSCFMLGDRLDIVTRPMQEFAEDTSPIRCTVDGVHESFYYAIPDPVDLERIGKHGTIVRVRLKETNPISANNDGKVWFRHFAHRRANDLERYDKTLFHDWNRHIHNIVTKFVGLPRRDIKVTIQLSDGSCELIERWDRPVTWQDLNIVENDLDKLEQFCRINRFGDYYAQETTPELVQVYACEAEHDGMEFSWLLKLPSSAEGAHPSRGLGALKCFGGSGLFVDGVHIDHNKVGGDGSNLDWFCSTGQLNFTGEVRPVLSVDRTTITSWPESIKDSSRELIQKVVSKTIAVTKDHFALERFEDFDPRVLAAWDYLLSEFYICKADFICVLATDERYAGVTLSDIAELTQNKKLTLREFLNAEKICMSRLAYQDLSHTAKLLFLAKCGNASLLTLDDSGLWVKGVGFSSALANRKSMREFSHNETLLRCDEWAGKLFEYDFVTDFWPVVSQRLFDHLAESDRDVEVGRISECARAIEIHRFSNGITALGEQDPCLVHPRLGLYQAESDSPFKKKDAQENKIGRFDKASNKHWLFEINNHYMKKGVPRYVLFIYISPRPLTADEALSMKEYETSDPEYFAGVRKGWSLLFLGQKHTNPIIQSGVISRDVMVKAIGEDVWQKLEGEEYLFLDGTNLRDLRNSTTNIETEST